MKTLRVSRICDSVGNNVALKTQNSACGNVVYRVEKSYVDKLVVWNPLDFNLLSFIDQNQFLFEVSYAVSSIF